MMEEIFGRKDGLCSGKGGSMHIADLSKGMLGANGIVGGGPPLVCGAALAAKTLGTGGVAVAFVGDGGSNQGTTAESLNLARPGSCRRSSCSRTTATPRAPRAAGRSRAIWSSAARATASRRAGSTATISSRSGTRRARRSSGPAPARARACPRQARPLLRPFRGRRDDLPAHGEIDKIKAEKDCLKIFRQRVTEAGLLEGAQLDEIDREVKGLIEQAVAEAKAAPPPTEADLLTDVYASY